MKTLCIDTAYKYLTCTLIEDDKIISSYSEECFKKQSEEVFNVLNKLFFKAQIDRQDIDAICISKGPGSYTGTRIGMTIAKVIGELLPCDIYTISTLRLYAGKRENCMVVLNARADRVYCGVYDNGNCILNDCVMPISEIDVSDFNIIGDGSLFGKIDDFGDIAQDFLDTRDFWEKVDNIAYLTPEYLKESESYLQ